MSAAKRPATRGAHRIVEGLLVIALLAPAIARPPPAHGETLEQLFPFAAEIVVAEQGLARLSLPDEVLAECRPALGDLRIFAAGGGEIPFLVDWGAEADLEARWSARARVLAVARDQTAREGLPAATFEEYELALPKDPPAGAPLELVIDAERASFVRTVSIAGDRGGEPVLLVDDRSLSRLGDGTELSRVRLPPFEGESVVVRIRGEEGGYLEPSFRFEASTVRKADPRSAIPLEIVAQRRDGDRTIVDLERPGALAVRALVASSTTPSFDRAVEVLDLGSASRSVRIGGGRLLRAGVRRPVEELSLEIGPAAGTQLRVIVHDGASPPLERLAFVALVQRPALIFSAPPLAAGAPRLLFGGGRADAPRYDVASLLPRADTPVSGRRAEVAERLREASELVAARLGPVRPNPAYDPEPVLEFAMRPGAPIDPRRFAQRRTLRIEPSPEGLSSLDLAAEDLAYARPDLGDVRVVDASLRQWPYLLDLAGTPSWLALAVERGSRGDKKSAYRLRAPAGGLRSSALRLVPRETFFDRPYELFALTSEGRRPLGAGRLVGRRDAREVVVPFAETWFEELELIVADGDDAALDLTAEARVDLPRLWLVAPPGEYFLLLGDPDAEAPRYDLDRARDMVRAVRAAPATAGAIEPNPEYRTLARLFATDSQRPALHKALVWTAIALAVGVLIFLTLRLARGGA